MNYIVYLTLCIPNNKIYIGVHKTNLEFFDGYIGCGVYTTKPSSYKKSKTPFQYAVNKYGVNNFKRVTLFSFNNEKEAYDKEKELVNDEFLLREDTYNVALGGSDSISSSKTTKVYMYDLSGEFVREFDSVNDAGKFFGMRAGGHLSRAIRCGHKFHDYQFSYKKVEKMKCFKKVNTKIVKQVGRFDINGLLLETFKSVSEAVVAGYNNAHQVIIGKRNHCKGFIFKYVN